MSDGIVPIWSTEPFTIDVRDAEDPVVVKLSGELDLATSPQLCECFERLAQRRGGMSVYMDLSSLTFVDSSGISVMVLACKRIRSEGGTFSLIPPQSNVRRHLEVHGVIDYLTEPLPA
jgi:anti-sigma B factor antagonist